MFGTIRAVLFDMDGLMFDTERLSDEIWFGLGPKYGLTVTATDMALLRGRSYEAGKAAFLAAHGADCPYDALAAEAREAWTRRLALGVPLRPGLFAALDFLQGHGIPMALASSTNRALVEQNLRLTGVGPYFSAVICGDMVAHSKPEPDIFLAAAKALAVPPEACLVLEDSANGVRAGAAAGCVTVMIPDLCPATEELRGLAEAVLPSLADVPKFLEGHL